MGFKSAFKELKKLTKDFFRDIRACGMARPFTLLNPITLLSMRVNKFQHVPKPSNQNVSAGSRAQNRKYCGIRNEMVTDSDKELNEAKSDNRYVDTRLKFSKLCRILCI
jgi:hypothetical protein